MKRLALIILFLNIPLFADTIYTWGYGPIFYEVLLSVTAFANDGFMIKIAGGIGILSLVMKKLMDSRGSPIMEIGKFFFLAAFVWAGFLSAGSGGNYQHVIEDRVTGYTIQIDGVPVAIGKALSFFTTAEHRIATAMELVMSTPASTQYGNAGLGFPLTAHATISQMHPIDPFVQRTFDGYLMNCLLFDLMDGTIYPDTLFASEDIMSDIQSISTRVTTVYDTANPTGVLKECSAAHADLVAQSTAELTKQALIASAQTGMITYGDPTAFINKSADVANLFFGVSKSSQDYMTQATTMNMMSTGFQNVAKVSGLDPASLAFGTAMAERTAQTNFMVSGQMAKKYLPLLKGILTLTIVGICWLLALLALTFFEMRYLTLFLTLMIWLMLWTPIAVIYNFITAIYLQSVLEPLATAGNWYTMQNKNIVDNEIMTALSWLGYLGWMIPIFSYAIAKGSDHGFTMLANNLSGAMGGATGQVSGEVARGNIRLGNVGIGQREITGQGYGYKQNADGAISSHGHSTGGYNMTSQSKFADGGQVHQTAIQGTNTSMQTGGSRQGIQHANIDGLSAGVGEQVSSQVGTKLQKAVAEKEHVAKSAGNEISSVISAANNVGDSTRNGNGVTLTKAQKDSVTRATAQGLEQSWGESDTMRETFQQALKGEIGADILKSVGLGGTDMKTALANPSSRSKVFGALAKGLAPLKAGGGFSITDSKGDIKEWKTSESEKISKNIQQSHLDELGKSETLQKAYDTVWQKQNGESHSEGHKSAKQLGQEWSASSSRVNELSETLKESKDFSASKQAQFLEYVREEMFGKDEDRKKIEGKQYTAEENRQTLAAVQKGVADGTIKDQWADFLENDGKPSVHEDSKSLNPESAKFTEPSKDFNEIKKESREGREQEGEVINEAKSSIDSNSNNTERFDDKKYDEKKAETFEKMPSGGPLAQSRREFGEIMKNTEEGKKESNDGMVVNKDNAGYVMGALGAAYGIMEAKNIYDEFKKSPDGVSSTNQKLDDLEKRRDGLEEKSKKYEGMSDQKIGKETLGEMLNDKKNDLGTTDTQRERIEKIQEDLKKGKSIGVDDLKSAGFSDDDIKDNFKTSRGGNVGADGNTKTNIDFEETGKDIKKQTARDLNKVNADVGTEKMRVNHPDIDPDFKSKPGMMSKAGDMFDKHSGKIGLAMMAVEAGAMVWSYGGDAIQNGFNEAKEWFDENGIRGVGQLAADNLTPVSGPAILMTGTATGGNGGDILTPKMNSGANNEERNNLYNREKGVFSGKSGDVKIQSGDNGNLEINGVETRIGHQEFLNANRKHLTEEDDRRMTDFWRGIENNPNINTPETRERIANAKTFEELSGEINRYSRANPEWAEKMEIKPLGENSEPVAKQKKGKSLVTPD